MPIYENFLAEMNKFATADPFAPKTDPADAVSAAEIRAFDSIAARARPAN